MTRETGLALPIGLTLLASCLALAPAEARSAIQTEAPSDPEQDDESSGGWSAGTNLSFAFSSGNAESGSIGLDAEAQGPLGGLQVTLLGRALRAQTGAVRRTAVGTPDVFEVRRTVERQVSASRVNVRARIAGGGDADSGAGVSAPFAAAGWERDVPAGVGARYDLTAGVGAAFGRSPTGTPRLTASAGVSFINQRDLVPDPQGAENTVGLRIDARSAGRFGSMDLGLASSSVLNLRRFSDHRFDTTGSAALPITSRMALRISLQGLYDGRPSLERVPLAPAPGATPSGMVVVRRTQLDLIFLTSLALGW